MTVFVEGLFRLLSSVPLIALHAVGWLMGWVVFALSSRYRQRLIAHVRQAGLDTGVALASVGEAGKMVAELPRLWLGRISRIGWEGAAHIEAAQAHGSGVLLLTPHLGCFEICARAYAEKFGDNKPITVLFRPPRQKPLQGLAAQARVRPGLNTAPTTLAGVKQLIKALKSGDVVGLLPDQVPPDGQGVWAPFFGRDAYTMTLSARLAHTSNVKLLLIWGERLSWGRGYIVRVRPFEGSLSKDPGEAAGQINLAMESLIRERPSQYLWSYNRYKPPSADHQRASPGRPDEAQ